MRKTALLRSISLFVVILSAAATASPKITHSLDLGPPYPSENGVYTEDFATHAVMEDIDNADWDTLTKRLTLLRRDGIRQNDVSIVADGAGGYAAVWVDQRTSGGVIFAQRIDADGFPLWPFEVQVSADGIAMQTSPGVGVDRFGHIFVIWRERRAGIRGLYAQCFTPEGTRLWTHDVQVSSHESATSWATASIAVDRQGQATIAWQDDRNGNDDVYAQRLTTNGTFVWGDGIRVNSDNGILAQKWPAVAVDNSGNAMLAWVDWRNRGGEQFGELYAQRLGPDGNRLWATDLDVSGPGPFWPITPPAIAMSSTEDAVVAWIGGYYGYHVYANRFQPDGRKGFFSRIDISPSGVYNLGTPSIAADSFGHIMVVWMDLCRNVRAQALDSSNMPLWDADLQVNNGDSPCFDAFYWDPVTTMDDTLGALVAWTDQTYGWEGDIRAQRLSLDGRRQWQRDRSINEMGGSSSQSDPKIKTDPIGHLTVAWVDWRNGRGDVYIQKFDQQGNARWLSDVKVAEGPRGGHGLTNMYQMAVDTNGNSTIVWSAEIDGISRILAQRVDPRGNKLWATARQVNHLTDDARYPVITGVSDGRVLIAWFASGVYVQSLDAQGNTVWPQEKQVNGANNDPSAGTGSLQIATNPDGRASITWQASQDNTWGRRSYAQALDAGGNRLWPDDTLITSNGEALHAPCVAVDQNGNTYLVWNTATRNISAQKLNAQGTIAWAANVQVNSVSGDASSWMPQVALDLAENTLVVWSNYYEQSVYAQKLGTQGTKLWSSDMRISADGGSSYGQARPGVVVTNNDSAFVAWEDERKGNLDVFVQGINRVSGRVWPVDMQVVLPDRFYYPAGSAQSRTVDTVPGGIREAILTADQELNGGAVHFSITNNGGADWFSVSSGVTHVFTTTGSDLRWRVELAADPLWPRTPVISNLRIEYSTALPYADDYEPDDTCAAARPIAINGAAQDHTLHQQVDADWAWFDARAGTTYIVETRNTGARANTVIEAYPNCTAPPAAGGRAFGPGYTISVTAPSSGRYYLKVSNHDPAAFGADTGYTLSTRATQPSAVAVIIAGHDNAHSAQENITYAADRAYRVFRNAGIPKANIRYLAPQTSHDADGDGINDIAGPPTVANVRDAVQDWARERGVALGVPFYLYLVDHGLVDRFKANGDAADHHVTATELNLWLSNLEATSGGDNLNMIIDACYSGSFIDQTTTGPATIAGRNRVVIASTTSDWLAFGPAEGQGLYFSNAFFSALENEQSLYASYLTATRAVETQGLLQRPWLDDNGDSRFDSTDGALASDRALRRVSLGGLSPRIEWISGNVRSGQISTRISDDSAWVNVQVEIFAPSYVPPASDGTGTTQIVAVPTVTLTDPDGDGSYTASYPFVETGRYRLIAHAQDSEGNLALPMSTNTLPVGAIESTYLPMVAR